MKDTLRFTVLLIIVLVGIFLPVKAQTKPAADSEQLKVYEAALGHMDHIDKKDLHITIFSHTLNSKCWRRRLSQPASKRLLVFVDKARHSGQCERTAARKLG